MVLHAIASGTDFLDTEYGAIRLQVEAAVALHNGLLVGRTYVAN